MKITQFSTALLLALSLGFASRADAHSIWMEADKDGNPQICFGEYDDGLRENAEKLEKLGAIKAEAMTADGAEPVQTRMGTNSLQMVKAPKGMPLVFRAENMAVRDQTKHGGVGMAKPMIYGRYVGEKWSAQKSVLPLDLVPVEGSGHVVKAEFRGQPLAKTALEIVAPNGWKREIRTDEAGQATLSTPWPGLYVVSVKTQDKKPGEHEGKKYDVVSYTVNLSFVIP